MSLKLLMGTFLQTGNVIVSHDGPTSSLRYLDGETGQELATLSKGFFEPF